jgi:hypothetical protein
VRNIDVADITVRDKNDQIVLAVKVHRRLNTSEAWAEGYYQVFVELGQLPQVPFFLLGTPDHFYLWKYDEKPTKTMKPSYIIDPTPFLKSHYHRFSTSISKESLILVVDNWLDRLVHLGITSDLSSEEREWLVGSGLFDAIAGGRSVIKLAA